MVSDVPGDEPAIVGSGPTIPSASTAQDALAVLNRYCIPVSEQTKNAMLENESGAPAIIDDPRLQANETVVIATAQQALGAAAAVAAAAGY